MKALLMSQYKNVFGIKFYMRLINNIMRELACFCLLMLIYALNTPVFVLKSNLFKNLHVDLKKLKQIS